MVSAIITSHHYFSMAVVASKLVVTIDEQEYHLDVIPAAESKVVETEKEKLLGAVDLETLVNDLGRVGAFIRVAYNGVGAAGPKFTELLIEVQDLGYDITKLCDQSALTVSKFKKASATVLDDLQATYGYLLDNLEDLALETLSSVSKIAADMETAATALQQEFTKEEQKVVNALKKTQLVRGEEAKRIDDKKREYAQAEEALKHQQKLLADAQKMEKEAEKQRQQIEMNEDEAIQSIKHATGFQKMINAMFQTEIFDDGSAAKQKAQQWKEKRIEALETENKFRKMRYEALDRMTSFAAKMKNCTTEANMAEAATNALHEAITALKELSAVMMQAAQFWKQMQDHCKTLAEDRLKNMVEKAIQKHSEEVRLKVWTSTPFKRMAVRFYAGWVALNSVCAEYVEQIKVTQQDLYKYITENPTYEQCRMNVKDLAENFLSDLIKDRKAIAAKEFKAEAEIQALQSN